MISSDERFLDRFLLKIINFRHHYGHHAPPGTVFKPKGEGGPIIYPTYKYTQDLFYILPFYHKEFPASLKRVMVFDTDLLMK